MRGDFLVTLAGALANLPAEAVKFEFSHN